MVGDTPNLAARLQGAAEPGMVVIAEATRRLLGDLFVLRDLGAQTFKGIQGPTAAFAVLGERALESRFAARQAGGVAPIVGRDQELALAARALAAGQERRRPGGSAHRRGGDRQVRGSPKLWSRQVAGEPHFLLRYQCSPYHADSALYPVIQQLSYAAGFAADRQRGSAAGPAGGAARQGHRRHARGGAADGGALGYRRRGALRRADADAAAAPQPHARRPDRPTRPGWRSDRPVLWVIEDAHWIDPTTLELIELALDRVQGARVLDADHRASDLRCVLRQSSGGDAAGAEPARARGDAGDRRAHHPRQALAGRPARRDRRKDRRRAAVRRGDDQGGDRVGRAARDGGRLSPRSAP